jgi:hypothetical protein
MHTTTCMSLSSESESALAVLQNSLSINTSMLSASNYLCDKFFCFFCFFPHAASEIMEGFTVDNIVFSINYNSNSMTLDSRIAIRLVENSLHR